MTIERELDIWASIEEQEFTIISMIRRAFEELGYSPEFTVSRDYKEMTKVYRLKIIPKEETE